MTIGNGSNRQYSLSTDIDGGLVLPLNWLSQVSSFVNPYHHCDNVSKTVLSKYVTES